MQEKTKFVRQELVSELFRTPHGKLGEYLTICQAFSKDDPLFMSHLIAYNHRHGSVRDAQVGLPVVTLATPAFPRLLVDNSLAHLALLNPKDLLRAFQWGKALRKEHAMPWRRYDRFEHMVHGYLRAREACWPWWERTALWFRQPLKTLYALSHTKACDEAAVVLFHRQAPPGTLFERVKQSAGWESDEVAGFIRMEKLPFLVSQGLYGKRIQEPAILAAVIDNMSAGELSRRAALLAQWGWENTGATRGAKQVAMGRARRGAKRSGLLAATKAQQTLAEDDPLLAQELVLVQEAQLDAQAGIEGNWLVGIDISGSMEHAMQPGLLLAAYLARQVRGKVLLCFFNHEPYAKDVTGRTYAELVEMTKLIVAQGGTSIGCGVAAARERQFEADAIAIVSDGGERDPPDFGTAYRVYSAWLGKAPPVYLYRVPGQDPDWLSARWGSAMPYQCFPVEKDINEAGVVALAATMKTQRYSLMQEIMDAPLLTMEQALRPPRQWRTDYAVTT